MNLYAGIRYHTTVASKDGMVTCGGMNGNGPQPWCALGYSNFFPTMEDSRLSFGMAMVNDELYAIGGRFSLNTWEWINVTKIDGQYQSWKKETLPFTIWQHCVVGLKSQLMVIGGSTHNDVNDPSRVRRCYAFRIKVMKNIDIL